MDPILLELCTKSCGLSVNGLFVGALSHTDDIHTLLTNLADYRNQISFIHLLTSSCNLSLNANKCEAVISPSVPGNASSIRSDDIVIPISHSARYLGAWWSTSLRSNKWIEEKIRKARGAFLPEVMWCFEPTFLQEHHWVMCSASCIVWCGFLDAESGPYWKSSKLRWASVSSAFQRPQPTIVVYAGTQMAIRAHVLCIKLVFLLKTINSIESLSSHVFHSLTSYR